MKRKHWIGGVLLVMALWGITGCGKAEAPPARQMVDGPGMMYTPEDQSPFAGTWQSRDGSIVMEVESSDPFESSRIQVLVDGEPDFASDAWVYKTGHVKLTQEHKDMRISRSTSAWTAPSTSTRRSTSAVYTPGTPSRMRRAACPCSSATTAS